MLRYSLIFVIFTIVLPSLFGQKSLTESEALQLVQANHPAVHAAQAMMRSTDILEKGASRTWEPADIYHNITADPDYGMFGTSALGLNQKFPSARQTRAQRSVYQQQKHLYESEKNWTKRQLSREVRAVFQHLSYLQERQVQLRALDSLYVQTAAIAESRYRHGEVSADEQLAARDLAARIRIELETVGHEMAFDQQVLGQLLGLHEPVLPIVEPFRRRNFDITDTSRVRGSALAQVMSAKTAIAEALVGQEKAKRSPVFTAGANVQYLANHLIYPGWVLGLQVPLAAQSYRAKAAAANVQADAARAEFEATVRSQQMKLSHLLHEVEKYSILLDYHEREGKTLAAELRRSAFRRYEAGETDFVQFAQSAERAARLEIEYLENLNNLNLTLLEIEAMLP